ncbi:hypothetical protein [Pseudoalteromonas sp. SWXJZ10B]|uniref:hypothetical protein n=1 Tax=Pseudoalteromonas sp. SWXJZ10B TaxID=2792063 RepID=UPI0018CD8F29|nr:hypothetical protein [Pseudoalteromonas sp. SWXJZ10B]MBH0041426.1 hypothetical protein [Pseudoalteromonas sp. SWXJZ10B]
MDLNLDSFFHTVISMSNVDHFTMKEVSVGFCCLTKTEHFELSEIERKVSGYVKKLLKKGQLEESSIANNKFKTYKKTRLFYDSNDITKTRAWLLTEFIKDCRAQRARFIFEMFEYDKALEVYSKSYANSHDLEEIMKPAHELLKNKSSLLKNKIGIIEQLIELYNREVLLVLKSDY